MAEGDQAGLTDLREARWRAARLLGNTTLAREDARAVWIAPWRDHLRQDVHYAVRTLWCDRGFTIAASLTLAVGIGVLVSVFTVFHAIYLKPWPVRDARSVFGISQTLMSPGPDDSATPFLRVSYQVLQQIRDGLRTADLTATLHHTDTLRLTPGKGGRNARVALVDDVFMDTVGVPFHVGGLPEGVGTPAIAISFGVWEAEFGRDASILGRTIWLGSKPAVVTGVIAKPLRGFGSRVVDGYARLNETAGWLDDRSRRALLTDPKECCVEIYGRLKPGASREQATAEIEARVNTVHGSLGLPLVRVVAWTTEMASRPGGVRDTVPTLFALLFTGCGIVTLLACANIGNLQLARTLRRTREIAVRLSLGAGRGRVVRQLLTESALLSLIGTAGALVIAWTLPGAVMALDRSDSALTWAPEGLVFAFAAITGAAAVALFGLAPALRVTRIDWRGVTSGIAGGAGRLRSVLLGVQVALSLGLIASAVLLSRGALRAASGADAGFAFDNRYAYAFVVTGEGAGAAHRRALGEAIAADATLALAETAPWMRGQPRAVVSTPGRDRRLTTQWANLNRAAVSLLELRLVSGRWPQPDPRLNEVTISWSIARGLWDTEDPLGRTIETKHPIDGVAMFTVVGLMDEVRFAGPDAMPAVVAAYRGTYLPTVLAGPGRTAELQAIATRFDPSVRVLNRRLVDHLRGQFQAAFVGMSVASGLGGISLLLASLGLFGVFAYLVEDRRREIGVRLALGARPADIRHSVTAAARWPIVGGLAAGVALAMVGGMVLRNNLYGLSVLDPVSYLGVTVILSLAAIAATAIPLRRATRVDPAITLRHQ